MHSEQTSRNSHSLSRRRHAPSTMCKTAWAARPLASAPFRGASAIRGRQRPRFPLPAGSAMEVMAVTANASRFSCLMRLATGVMYREFSSFPNSGAKIFKNWEDGQVREIKREATGNPKLNPFCRQLRPELKLGSMNSPPFSEAPSTVTNRPNSSASVEEEGNVRRK